MIKPRIPARRAAWQGVIEVQERRHRERTKVVDADLADRNRQDVSEWPLGI
jgi:hypothetical protein